MALKKNKSSHGTRKQDNTLRIIGGSWRGRKVSFASEKGLRPTLDRVRETLFNWLQADINQAYCLDLFSGSGALAFEALSRGAFQVDIVDINPHSIHLIKENLGNLDCSSANVFLESAEDFIQRQELKRHALSDKPYDIVFLDPPFNQDLLLPVCQQLNESSLIHSNSLIYIETEAQLVIDELPDNWQCYRQKQTKTLSYYLFNVQLQEKK